MLHRIIGATVCDTRSVCEDAAGDTGTGESHCPCAQCCCVCSVDILVHCRASQRSATAHHGCTGYTATGAKRANLKFHCPTCHVKKLLSKPKKSRSHSPSPIATFAIHEATQPPVRKKSCLCDEDNFCSSCVSLEGVAKRPSKSLSDSRRENQTLQLHILSLEGKICALEETVKYLGRLESVEKEIESQGSWV